MQFKKSNLILTLKFYESLPVEHNSQYSLVNFVLIRKDSFCLVPRMYAGILRDSYESKWNIKYFFLGENIKKN